MLDSSLFAEGPARDERFVVKDRWIECTNLPPEHPLRPTEFFHRQMNEEINGLECSARCLADFPDADWEIRMWLSRQCADEARHAIMFRRILEERGGFVGQFPVLNFQYRIINRIDTLVGRLAIQNRSFEAGGIDAIAFAVRETRVRGDFALADLHEAQLADEIVHVRFANDWIHSRIQHDRKVLLQIGMAMAGAEKAFFEVMGAEGTEGVRFAAAQQARFEAGFSYDEVKLADELVTRRFSAADSSQNS